MTILWFGLGLCFLLLIFFCVLSAMDSSDKEVSTQKPPFRNPSPEANQAEQKVVNISEPVLSFVETVRNQPQRFITEQQDSCYWVVDEMGEVSYTSNYFLIDKKTGEWWCTDNYSRLKREATDCTNLVRYCENEKRLASDHSWLTEDEMNYLIKEITSIYGAHKDRAEKLKSLRKQRRDKQERSRLMKIYVEG